MFVVAAEAVSGCGYGLTVAGLLARFGTRMPPGVFVSDMLQPTWSC